MRRMIDVTEQISAVRRQVGARTLESGEARIVTVSQSYGVPLDDLWDACTDAERISRWFLPCSGELKAGGHYELAGNASGTVTRCDPPQGFDATWEYGGEVSWIEVRLTPESPGRTQFRLDHIAHVDDARWLEFGPGAVGVGWDSGLLGLAPHLATGKSMDPAEGQAWAASPEGKRFMTLSSESWRAASVEAGTDPAEAKEAADRTTAAYTGAS
ncbi:MAG: hypothetical protein QOI35_3009 [Cryptosporangiaceae bacterium]|nr:hypothetical protein [Cryptosporangiaceae bacterium]